MPEKCGLFLSKMIPYLAASPDGEVDEDSILEINAHSCLEMRRSAQLLYHISLNMVTT
jgi:hypothetical protein